MALPKLLPPVSTGDIIMKRSIVVIQQRWAENQRCQNQNVIQKHRFLSDLDEGLWSLVRLLDKHVD